MQTEGESEPPLNSEGAPKLEHFEGAKRTAGATNPWEVVREMHFCILSQGYAWFIFVVVLFGGTLFGHAMWLIELVP